MIMVIKILVRLFMCILKCFCYYDPDIIQSLRLLRLDSFPQNCARCWANLPSHEIVHQTLVMAHGMQLWSMVHVIMVSSGGNTPAVHVSVS